MNIQTALEKAEGNQLSTYLPRRLLAGVGLRANAGLQLAGAYSRGFHGCFGDGEEMPAYARTLARYANDELKASADKPTRLEERIPSDLHGIAASRPRVLSWIPYLLMNVTNGLKGAQDYGNCVAWAIREILNCLIAMAEASGQPVDWYARVGTALTYGSRGHGGQGAVLAKLIQVCLDAGVQLEKQYVAGDEPWADLRDEDTDEWWGNRWGRRGPPELLKELAGEEGRLVNWAFADDEDAIADAFALGKLGMHGSNYTANQDGALVSRLRRIGGHAQGILGYDGSEELRKWLKDALGYTLPEGKRLWIHDQSWGSRWNLFPDREWPPMWGPIEFKPEGVWIVDSDRFMYIVRQWRDNVIMIAGLEGFDVDTLADWGAEWALAG